MSSELLHCTICPKKPHFSDASHLLTHVSSKGHLSSLHKLQVRSHQEASAGHELAVYNHWYHEHDVARLLSQRLLDKEAKQADKRAANRRRGTGPKGGKSVTTPGGPRNAPLTVSAYSAEASILRMRKADKARNDTSDSDSSFTPLRRSKRITIYASSPLKQGQSKIENDETVLTHAVTKSNGIPQLKGTIWPGMYMFDAAPDEMKKKRNQRKDGSVLIKMQKVAAMVEPTETVHSATGEILTQRHIDELETASPVPGEPHVVDASPRPRRTRATKGTDNEKTFGRTQRGGRVQKLPPTRKSRGRSTLHHTRPSTPRYAPTEDENMEFKLTVGYLGRIRKSSTLQVYQDLSSSNFGSDRSAEAQNPFFSQPMGSTTSTHGHLAYLPTAYASEMTIVDPYRPLRERLAAHDLSGSIHDKENVAPVLHTMLHGCSPQMTASTMLHHDASIDSAEQLLSSSSSMGGPAGGMFSYYNSLNDDGSLTPSSSYFPNPLMPINNSAGRRRLPKPWTPSRSVVEALDAPAPLFE